MPSFLVLRLQHTQAGTHPNRSLKKDTLAAKNGYVLLKNILFKLNFQDEGHLDSNFLIDILTTHRECLLFQFLSRDICMDIATLTGVQKEHINSYKAPHNFLKNVLQKLYVQHEGHWYGNSRFYILTIYYKYVLFQFLCCDIRNNILILKEVQKRHISSKKLDIIR